MCSDSGSTEGGEFLRAPLLQAGTVTLGKKHQVPQPKMALINRGDSLRFLISVNSQFSLVSLIS